MLAAFCTEPGRFAIRQTADPEPGPTDVIVRVQSCGVCGSDLHFFHGDFPPPPVCPGHEISGQVVEVGRQVRQVRPDDRVAIEPLVVCGECPFCRTGDYQLCPQMQIVGNFVDGGFAERLRVPASATFQLPSPVDYEVGALAEPLAVAVHGARLANIRIGDRVLVLGAGTIGLLSIAAAKAAGAGEVWVTARHPQQCVAAESLGASRVFSGADASNQLAAATDTAPIDVVVETVGGHADTLNEALMWVRRGGTVCVLGVFTSMPSLNALLLVVRELRLIGSMTYGRFGTRADFDVALQLLAAQPELFRRLVTHRVPLTEIERAFAIASDKSTGAIKVAIRPSSKEQVTRSK